MNKTASKKAMARTRARRMASLGKIPLSETGLDAADAQASETREIQSPIEHGASIEEKKAPSESADVSLSTRARPALMLVVDEEEEAEFCAPPTAPPLTVIECGAGEPEGDASDLEPPFDPPNLDELLLAEEIEDEEEPPFDPADIEELTAPTLSVPVVAQQELVLAPANENARGASLGPPRNAQPDGARDQPAPAIRIYLSWDRPIVADFFGSVAKDSRLSRTEITIARGGLDGAAIHCAVHQRPDLVVVDTTLRGPALLASLDRLMQAAGRDTKVIVLGAVNDVTLLREMAQRGVDEYLIWPIKPPDVAGSICALFAGKDKARVIAVVGARGGIGASTIAHNLAWCMAERQRARTTLIDLDLAFGTAAFDFKLEPLRSLGDVIDGSDAFTDVALERISTKRTERLTILSAPAHPRYAADLDADAARAMVAAARRLSSFVVLDLPHLWSPWLKQTLLDADEVVLVSSPDIASLRNTDNIAKALKVERNDDPIVVLSMAGVPKRPEVPSKEFAEALTITPACSFAFEPNIFGAATITGQMLSEIAPDSKAAGQIEELSTLLTGRQSVDVLHPEPRIFETSVASLQAPPQPADPFEAALVNAFALEDTESEPLAAGALESESVEQPAMLLAPLELLELTPIEPEYLARARAAALEELDTIETTRRAPEPRFALSPVASFAAGFAITALAVTVLLFMRTQAAPAPAAALVSTDLNAAPPPTPSAPLATPAPLQLAAQYQAAAHLIDQNMPQDALAPMQRLAQAGFVMAQYRLAKMYERGEGVAADLVQARIWTERAASGGNRNAMHDLGVYYARGEGAPRDDVAARRYFQQAAELGLVDSQYNLGLLYEAGRGVGADIDEALFWFRLAANQGDQAAAERASEIELGLTPYDLEQVDTRVAAFQPRLADPIANGEFAPPPSPTGPPPSHAVGTLPTTATRDQTPR